MDWPRSWHALFGQRVDKGLTVAKPFGDDHLTAHSMGRKGGKILQGNGRGSPVTCRLDVIHLARKMPSVSGRSLHYV